MRLVMMFLCQYMRSFVSLRLIGTIGLSDTTHHIDHFLMGCLDYQEPIHTHGVVAEAEEVVAEAVWEEPYLRNDN